MSSRLNKENASSNLTVDTAMRPMLEKTEEDSTMSKKKVSFCEEARVRVYNRKSMLEEKANLWYSEQEIYHQRRCDLLMFANMKRKLPCRSLSPDVLVEVMQSIGNESNQQQPTWDIRGLESWIDGGNQRARNRLNAVLAVLMEQDRQDLEGDFDDGLIAMRYSQFTENSSRSAYRRAEVDRKAIECTNTMKITKGGPVSASDMSRYVEQPVLNTVPSRAA